MATDECTEEYTCKKNCQYNNKVKEALQFKYVAFGCWMRNDVSNDMTKGGIRTKKEMYYLIQMNSRNLMVKLRMIRI